jgi:hypothetical protein
MAGNPINKDRMSRRQPKTSRPGRRVEDPKEAYTVAQLAEVGAIALIWNQIDNFLDWLLHIALRTPLNLHWDIARRIRGSYAKVELLRLAADRAKILTDEAGSV